MTEIVDGMKLYTADYRGDTAPVEQLTVFEPGLSPGWLFAENGVVVAGGLSQEP